MSEVAFNWSQDQFIKVVPNEPVRFLFLFTEPKPDYAEGLLRELNRRQGQIHRSKLKESLPVTVVDAVADAHAIVTFWQEGWRCVGAEERLAYITVLAGFGIGCMGSVCVTDHLHDGIEKHRNL